MLRFDGQPMLTWQCVTLPELSATELHAVLALRQAVFIIEQRCVYPDIDNADLTAFHLLGWEDSIGSSETTEHRLITYLRVLPPHAKHADCALGRILTALDMRGCGVGRLLLTEGLRRTTDLFPGIPIRISAQLRLQRFYEEFGFVRVSAPYDEDGIEHVDMRRTAL